MQDVVIPIDLGQGIDSKTDPKLVMANKFQVIKDGIFTNTKRITKRNGYTQLTMSEVGTVGNISSPHMMRSFGNELVCAGTGSLGINRFFSYSETLSGWVDRGKYPSVAVSKTVINGLSGPQAGQTSISSFNGTFNSSSVTSGNIALYAFDKQGAGFGIKNSSNRAYITVVDTQTGTHLLDAFEITGSIGFSKTAILGSSTLAVFYIESSISHNLAMRVITVTLSGSVVVGSPVTIGPCVALATITDQFPFCYDISNTSTGAMVAVSNQPNIDLYKINTAGTATATASIASAADIYPISTTIDSSNNLWVYWGSVTSSTSVYYAIYSSSLAVVLVPTVIDNLLPVQQITAIATSATQQTVYYSHYTDDDSFTAGGQYPVIYYATATLTGTVGSRSFGQTNVDIYGKIFTIGSKNYLPCVSASQTGATGFIVDLSGSIAVNVAVAKFLQLEAEGIYQQGYGLSGATGSEPVFLGVRYPGFLNSAQTISSTQVSLACGFVTSIIQTALTSTTNLSCYPVLSTTKAIMGVASISFDFNSIDAFQGLVQQDTMVLNGGIVSMYDGAYVSELGFNIDPDCISAKVASSGGSIPAGTYIYYATFEWIDAKGNLYESAPSPGVAVFLDTGSSNKVSVLVPVCSLTQKANVSIKLWRSDSNQGGNIAYLVAVATSSVFSTVDDASVQILDSTSSTAAVLNATLYTEAGAVLENVAPPPSMILWTNNNRIWAIDSENPETLIEYSKTASSGTGIGFSTGQLELVIDSKNGPVTGVSPMDEKTVILKQYGAGYFIGDGANDSGTGSSLSPFQFIPSDVGCTNSKSVILYPGGILFRTTKGIYEVNRGVQVSYFGMAVEAYNSQDIQATLIVPSKNQIRMLTSSGYSLLYDYVMGQWSVFTNHTGYSSCNWQDTYIYARTDGSIYQENTTSFLDNTTAYSLILQSAWLALSSVQNFQRAKQVLPLGDYTNGSSASHGIQIQAAYDFSPTFGTAIPFYFGAASSSGVFQYRNFFSQQKCDTVSLLISEVTTGASGESMDLTNMSFVAGIKKGTNKLSPAKSVG